MKNIFFIILALMSFSHLSIAQKTSPVAWDFKLIKINAHEYKFTATATMQPTWVLYSQFTDPEGPVPTTFTVNGKQIQLKEESHLMTEMDEMFMVEVKKFKNTAVFSTVVHKEKNTAIKGDVEFMTCDGLRCLPPTKVPFELNF